MKRIGLKIYLPEQVSLINHFSGLVDFVEVMAVRDYPISAFDQIKLPIVIHAEHESFGVNLANRDKQGENMKSISHCIKLADRLGANKIVVHPGFVENDNCSEGQILKVLENFDDKRILIENMFNYNYEFFCSDIESMRRLLQAAGKGFCLDFGHATLAALQNKIEPLVLVRELANLDPSHCHVHDTVYETLKDHQHLGCGDSPLKDYLEMVDDSIFLTLETSKENNDVISRDISYIKNI